ncbi:DsbA family oxidoreductase [Marinobacterium mangrovicola]|uniref:Putative DsbA family dithiol-disulfide isomerase n=1 Tax=Marinobacterium mangrovicola TaxID=1476959 RepID=A0A4R1GCY3_9GAMM|nr:DsbA family oxidoreductase [Marinobacterium mangrovicola]TCK05668.1 putative DsbA family dithiol-disulfide isomerase [Marinobacterium mangrovicola]
MPAKLRIDFVSDVMCPWCAIGLHSLLLALEQLNGEVEAEIHFHPFELTPDMPAEGERVIPYLCNKYGISEAQVAQNQAQITERGADLGFKFDFRSDSRKWNTFNTHRLLHWAGEQNRDKQLALKLALFDAYFSHNLNPSDRALLCDLAGQVGLDAGEAGRVYDTDLYAEEVRSEEALWQQRGVSSVPAIVFNERYLVSGGQPVETFVQVIRDLLAQSS